MTNIIRGRDKFYKYKTYINLISKIYGIFPLSIRIKIFEFHRMTKGIKGIVLRYALLKAIAIKCGENVSVHPGVYLLSPDKLIIGDNVSIHPMCYIDAGGGIVIGDDVSIAHASTILSTTHKFKDINIPIKDQGIDLFQTTIENNVWIGAKTTILCGNKISSGTIIAASSVITKDTKINTIVGGIPAKLIKDR